MKKPERTWNDPPMPGDTVKKFETIMGCFTRKGATLSLAFNWFLWGIVMVQTWLSKVEITATTLIATFMLITAYAILISPIVEWSWNMATGKKS